MVARPDGKSYLPNSLTHAFDKLARRVGLPPGFRFHDLRHTAATLALLAGTDLKTVSVLLGHSGTAKTADLYAHALEQQDRHAATGWHGVAPGAAVTNL